MNKNIIIKAIKEKFGKIADGIDLYRGNGYWYFSGGIADHFKEQGVYVFRLNEMGLNSWINEFKDKLDNINKLEIRKASMELIRIANLIAALTPEEKEEALKHYQKRKYTDYGPLFKQQRTYFPFSSSQKEIETPKDIINFLDENGYDILNYREGLAIKKNNKQQIGIGKILNRFKRTDLKKLFDERLGTGKKVLEDLKVVISWNPEDIAGMSTDRGWTSCQNLRGYHPQVQVWEKIEGGGMVAYLIYSDDKNIEKPLSRVSIRRYINKSDSSNFIFYPSYVCYGVENKDFVKFVRDKIEENNKETGEGIAEYEEGEGGYKDIFPKKMGIMEWIEMGINNRLSNEQIKKLEDLVIKSGNWEWIFKFAKYVKGADIKKLQETISKTTGDTYWVYHFAKEIEGADIKKLEETISKTGDAFFIFKFAQNVEGADKERLMRIYEELKKKKSSSVISSELIRIARLIIGLEYPGFIEERRKQLIARLLISKVSINLDEFNDYKEKYLDETKEYLEKDYENITKEYNRQEWLDGLKDDDQKDLMNSFLDRYEKKENKNKLINDIMNKLSELLKSKNYMEVRNFRRKLFDLESYIKYHGEDYKKPEESIKETEEIFDNNYKKYYEPVLNKLEREINKFCDKVGFKEDIEIIVLTPSDNYTKDILEAGPSVVVEFIKGLKPSFTVFIENGKYEIDDVLEYGDSDFFDNVEISNAYFKLIDFLRTGKLPEEKSGFIKLYRGMSPKEYDAWKSGEKIPIGKFFTSKRTSQLGLDISGEYPELYQFTVDSKIVIETDKDTYQLTKEGKLIGNKIVKA